ncbi:MAG: SDR family NAD(P)-dependent oxidoreductase [Acetobacteraceae bacterium]
MAGRLDQLFSLKGHTALATGGSSGIGLALAEALGLQGARIVLVLGDLERLRRLATEGAAIQPNVYKIPYLSHFNEH